MNMLEKLRAVVSTDRIGLTMIYDEAAKKCVLGFVSGEFREGNFVTKETFGPFPSLDALIDGAWKQLQHLDNINEVAAAAEKASEKVKSIVEGLSGKIGPLKDAPSECACKSPSPGYYIVECLPGIRL